MRKWQMSELTKTTLTRAELVEAYHQMVLIRRFEEKCKELYNARKIGGVYMHLYSGQEATGVGAVKALKPTDHVITSYRDHGIAIAKGSDVKRLMAEMLGKRTGVSGGKGGSMHLADVSVRMWGGYAIVGGHLPLAAGIALKSKYSNDGDVVLCFVGDGATNNGYFHEALNLSAVWDLPVVWLIENNLYGMGTPVEVASGQPELHKRAIAYGMQDFGRVDGMDFFAVYEVAQQAVEYARTTGPALIEAITYRYEGHGVSDRIYMKRVEEMRAYQQRDPLLIMEKKLRELFPDIAPELAQVESAAAAAIEEAVRFAEESPVPTAEDLVRNVYA
ncbi:MAG: pyruvate dehydrogenase (acetyl-transferring) E1 component subunit alpha [Chloroflexi bacterium]|nr:pyruvate dehydrogenase (acetyl-transferring) E1 component subunit alpha [Chloroflexota bacterium]